MEKYGFYIIKDEFYELIEFENFLSIISREKFDYTKWQRNFYDKFDEGEVFERAVKYAETQGHTGKGVEV